MYFHLTVLHFDEITSGSYPFLSLDKEKATKIGAFADL